MATTWHTPRRGVRVGVDRRYQGAMKVPPATAAPPERWPFGGMAKIIAADRGIQRKIVLASLGLLLAAWIGLAWPARAEDRVPRVEQRQVERLELPLTLTELTTRVEALFSTVDRPLFLARRWQVIGDFYGFRAAKKELTLLEQRRDNLRALWRLTQQQTETALVGDVPVLQAHNAYLDSELALLKTTSTCREYLLRILESCAVEVATDATSEAAVARDPVRNRK